MICVIAGSAVLQGGVFGLSGMFPKEYTQAVMGGMVSKIIYWATILLTAPSMINCFNPASHWPSTLITFYSCGKL